MAINSANDLYISINDELRPWSDVSQDIIEYLKRRVESITHALVYKGSVEDLDALNAIENPGIGDMYNVVADKNANYAWNGSEWDSLGPLASTIDPVAIQNSENAIQSGFIYDALMNYATYSQVQAIIDEVFGEQSIADITRNINQQFSDMNQDINDVKSQIAGYPDTLISEDDNNAIVLGTDHKLFVDNSENAELATQIGELQNSVTTNTNNISNLTELVNNFPEYSGATSEESGTAGLVPPALSDEKNYFLKGDGTWSEIEIPTISIYQGATDENDGVPGLVPSATSEEKEYFLKGNGIWSEIEIPVSVTDITNPNCLEKTIEEFSPNVDMYTAVTGYTEQEYDDFQNGLSVTGTPILDTNTGLHQNHENFITTPILYDIPHSIAISVSLWNLGDDDITSKFSLYDSNDEDIDINTVQIPLIPLQELLDAGDTGIELFKNFGIRNADKLIVKCTDNQDGTYTFTYLWRNSGIVPSFDLQLSNGTQKTVNMPCIFDVIDEKIGELSQNLVAYQGATTDANGIIGLVPAPQIADKDKYLKGDGTWGEIEIPVSVVDISDAVINTVDESVEEEIPGNIIKSLILWYTQQEYQNYVENGTTYQYTFSGNSNILYRGEHPVDPSDNTKKLSYITSYQMPEEPYAIFICANGGDDMHIDDSSCYTTIRHFENNEYDDISLITPIPLADIINAGETGYPLYEKVGIISNGATNFGGSNKKLFVKCVDNQDGTYTFSYVVRAITDMKFTVSYSDNTQKDVDLSSMKTIIGNALDDVYDAMSDYDSRVVHRYGDELISGIKTFDNNFFGKTVAVTGNTINVSNGNIFTKTISSDTTLSFTGVPYNAAGVFTLMLTNGGAYNVTFPSNVVWNGGEITLKENGTDILNFFTPDGGTTWYNTDMVDEDVSIPVYQGATSSANGVTGTVPAATSNDKDKFLKGDGTWSNTTTMLYEKTSEVTGSVIDLSNGSIFAKTVTANTTFSITHNIPSGYGACFTLILTNGGNYTVNWPNTILWTENTAPDLTENGQDVLTFITYDSGTTWYGTVNCKSIITV